MLTKNEEIKLLQGIIDLAKEMIKMKERIETLETKLKLPEVHNHYHNYPTPITYPNIPYNPSYPILTCNSNKTNMVGPDGC